MVEHESVFAAVVAAVRPLLLGGTIRDAERIALAALRAATAAGDAEHPLVRAAREQGIKPVTDVEHLAAAPEHRLSDEEFEAWSAAMAECRADPTEQLRTELDAANAELDRVVKRADFLDSALDGMRQQAFESVKERNAANERAERAGRSAQLLLDGQNELDRQRVETDKATHAEFEAAMDELREQRDEARARLAELRLLRLEWSTANCYSDLGDDIVSEQLARRRVASWPEIHTAVVSRQIYAGPWREGACRSCGTTERVAGDPPLCSGCAVYGAGWSSQRPDASLDGLRGPFTGLLGPFGIAPDVAQGATETESDQ